MSCKLIAYWRCSFLPIFPILQPQVLSTYDYPWLKCDQVWNTAACKSNYHSSQLETTESSYSTPGPSGFLENATEVDLSVAMSEYVQSMDADSMNASSILALKLTWLLLLIPLALGPKSLIWSFYVALPLALLCKVLLFIQAVSLPSAVYGLRFMFEPDLSRLAKVYTWLEICNLVSGLHFWAFNGNLIMIGKYLDEKTPALPSVLLATVGFLLLSSLETLIAGGMVGYMAQITGRDVNDFIGGYYVVPLALSTLPGSNFWLLVYFVSKLCTQIPMVAFFMELLATSFAEFLPGFWSRRTQFPRNLPLTLILGLTGLLISLIVLYLTSLHSKAFTVMDMESFRLQKVSYFLACVFIFQAIVLLALSKVASKHHEDLLSFVGRQMFCGSQEVSKAFLMLGVIIGMFLVGIFFPVADKILSDGFALDLLTSNITFIVVMVFIGVAILLALCWCCCQTICHCRNEERHPCCVPLGRRLDAEELLGEKFDMNLVVT